MYRKNAYFNNNKSLISYIEEKYDSEIENEISVLVTIRYDVYALEAKEGVLSKEVHTYEQFYKIYNAVCLLE